VQIFQSVKVDGRDHFENIVVGGRIILKWVLKKEGVGYGLFICFGIRTSGGCLMNLQSTCVFQNSGNLTSYVTVSFSIRTLLHRVIWLVSILQITSVVHV
jgi:hypothetical protein